MTVFNLLNVPELTQGQLIGLLEVKSRSGAFMCTIETRTEPRMNKTGNSYAGNVVKLSRVNVALNFIYGNAVNRQRDREGSDCGFVAQPRKWGERVLKTCFVQHKGKLYVEAKVEKSLSHEYLTMDGRVVLDSEIEPFLQGHRSSAESQGVDREIILRDYSVDSIVAITVDGHRHVVANQAIAVAKSA